MGFLNFFKREKEKPEIREEAFKKPIESKAEEMPEKIKETVNERLVKVNQDTNKIYEQILDGFQSIRKSNKRLELSSFEKHDKTYASVNMIKDTWVKRVYSSLDSISLISSIDYQELRDFHSNSQRVLNEIRKMTPKQIYLLSTYFKKESLQVIADIKLVDKRLDDLKKFLDNEGKVMWLLNEVNSKTDDYLKTKEKLDDLFKKESDIKKQIKELERIAAKTSSDLQDFLKSSQWKDLEKEQEEIETLSRKESELKYQITEELSAIKRPLKKLEHAAYFSKDQRAVLEKFIHSPMKTLFEHGESKLGEILLNMKKMTEEGKIQLKESEIEKIEEITQKIESGSFSNSKHEYENMTREIKNKKQDMEKEQPDMIKRKEGIEKEKEFTEQDMERLKKELEEIVRNQERIKNELLEKKTYLENLILKELGEKFIIKN